MPHEAPPAALLRLLGNDTAQLASEEELLAQAAKRLNELTEKEFAFTALKDRHCPDEAVIATMAELKEAVFFRREDTGFSEEDFRVITGWLTEACAALLAARGFPPEKYQVSADALNRYFLAALLDLQAGNGAEALRSLRILESYGDEIFRAYPHLYFYKGLARYATGDYAGAAEDIGRSLRHDPEDEIARFHLGNALFRQQRFEEAIAAYSEAMDRRRDFKEALINCALAVRKLGDDDTAREIAANEIVRRGVFEDGTLQESADRYALAISPEPDIYDIPVFINSYNRLGALQQLVTWLTTAGYRKIFILDNDSTYPPLLGYYRQLDEEKGAVQVLRLRKNLGHKSLWQSGLLEIMKINTPYVYTDPDIVPADDCPPDVLAHLLAILRKYPFLKKAGLGLKTDDITYPGAAATRQAEARFYLHEMEDGVYFGALDTTFALYRNVRHYNLYVAARTTGPFLARHLPWYYDYENLPEDERYYMDRANESATLVRKMKATTSCPQKPGLAIWCDRDLAREIVEKFPHTHEILCIIDEGTDGKTKETIANVPVVRFETFRKIHLKEVDSVFVLMSNGTQRMRTVNLLRYYGVPRIGLPRLHRAVDLSDKGIVWNEGRPYLSQLEIHIMDSCNLNCMACMHFSNLFGKGSLYDFQQFQSDLAVLSQKIFLSVLYLLGGEPFLNPHLPDYLHAARKNFPDAEIVLVTNGLLIPRQSAAVIKALRETETAVQISLYAPTAKIVDKIDNRLKGQGVFYEIRAERPAFMAFLGTKGQSDPAITQQRCLNAFCRYVRNGRLYKCPVDALSYKYREKFDVELPPAEGIDIRSADFERELSLLDQPVQLCRYCAEEPRVFHWQSAPHPAKEDWFGKDVV
ncbi:MAG: tetratricopeptide repeat protein [Schwartzia sp.]|nr:tetratricopeptide repeat protein [Schwartzia sp. (in: firmicutes)]